jgi:hypothetical protein
MLSLTKIIERITNIYDIKEIHYKNIINGESNDTYFLSYIFFFYYINSVKLEMF